MPDQLSQVEPQKLYDWLWALSEALFHEVACYSSDHEYAASYHAERRKLWHSIDDTIYHVMDRWGREEVTVRARSRLS